jgi:PhnB protein
MTRKTIPLLLVALALPLAACGGAPKADTAVPESTAAAASAPAPAPKPEVKPIPEGFFAITPQLVVADVDKAVAFYNEHLGATTVLTIAGADGKPIHADIKIGDSIIMIDQETKETRGPLALGGSPAALFVYVPDVDATVAALAAAGAEVTMPVEDQFWGDRWGEVVDPFGHRWGLATQVEELSEEQIAERAKLAFAPAKKQPKKGAPPAWKQIAGAPASSPVPAGYHTVTPSFVVADAAAAIAFYKAAFGATERSRMLGPDGERVLHAELAIGDSLIMLADAFPEMGSKSIADIGGSPVFLHHYVPDVDAVFARALAAGGTEVVPVADQVWGDRYGMLLDPAGLLWGVGTHVEDVSAEEVAERMKAAQVEAEPGK